MQLSTKLRLAIDVADGMTYLHSREPAIIHRDLKSKNIFCHTSYDDDEGNYIAKIGDWGSARAGLTTNKTMTHGVGTACWLAPEVIKYSRASKKSDVYSFGIILWEIFSNLDVYDNLTTVQIIARVANEKLRPEPIEGGSVCDNLMKRCWSEEPKIRPNFFEVRQCLNDLLSVELLRRKKKKLSFSDDLIIM